MSLLSHFLAERRVQKLKTAQSLNETALSKLQDELAGMGPSAIPALLEALSHGEARPAALAVLSRLLTASTANVFVAALASPNPAIVSGVSRVLSDSHGYPAEELLPALSLPRASRSMLESILAAQAERLPLDRLLADMNGYSRETQAMIMRFLERSAVAAHVPEIARLLHSDDPRIRGSAARILARFSGETTERAITGLLADTNKSVRLEAVNALSALKAHAAVPKLVPLLKDPDFKVQTAAIDALCLLGTDSAVPLLLGVLTDELDTARRAAVEVLNAVATPAAVQDLVRALRDQDWWVRVRAADALGSLGGEKVVQAVIGLLEDEDDFIRRHAVEVLNAVPNQMAVDPLIKSLADPDWWVRERAIDALAKTKDPRAIEPIVELMSQEGNIEVLCVRALGTLGLPDGLEPLVRACRSEREEVRNGALEALRSFPQEPLNAEQKALLQQCIGRVPTGAPNGLTRPMPIQPRFKPAADSPKEIDPRDSGTPAAPAPAAQVSSLNFSNLEPGTMLLDRYRVIRGIGRGGFGTVYLAEDQAVGEEMILKVLNPQFSADANVERRFVQELKLTRKITHKNVIRIYDFLDLGGAHAVSMEYFAGRDLGKVLGDDSPLDPARSLRILAQICEGLTAAHAVGVIHRDIKPANILVGGDDETRLVDFGLASAGQHGGSRLTKSGLLIGTPEYMAPEQISSEAVDHRSDLYSVGIVMFEMLTGYRPFTAETPVKVLFLHLEGEPLSMASIAPHVPASLRELTMSTMARNRDDRPASAQVLHDRVLEELALLAKAA